MIPRTFHRIWLGDKPMGADEMRWGESWLRLNPGWEERLWTGDSTLRNQRWFERAPNFSQASDFARYELVYDHGGIYIDTDFEALKPIGELLRGVEAFLVRESDDYFAAGIFGAVPEHPLLRAVIEALPASAEKHRGGLSNHATGPVFLTGLLDDNPGLLDGVTVFETGLFFPYPYGRPDLRHGPFPDAYGAHHWAGSWIEADPQPSSPEPEPFPRAEPESRWRRAARRVTSTMPLRRPGRR